MKIKEKKDLLTKTLDELKTLVKDAQKELVSLRLEHAQQKLKNARSIFAKRRDIAQILSVIHRKEVGNEKNT